MNISTDTIAAFVCVNVHFPVSGPDNGGYVTLYVNPLGDAFDSNVPIVVLNADNKYEPTGTLIVIVVAFSCNLNQPFNTTLN